MYEVLLLSRFIFHFVESSCLRVFAASNRMHAVCFGFVDRGYGVFRLVKGS